MTTFFITLGAGIACGIAVGLAVAWIVTGTRTDARQVELFQLRRHLANLRDVNTKLSQRCGHCGTMRGLPADRQTGGAL
jgi:thymidine kinase